MPSQITHYLFAKEVIQSSLGKQGGKMLGTYNNLIAWGAQRPDFFYHNQRSRPTAFKYGRILHRGGYGTLLYHFLPHCFTNDAAKNEAAIAFIYAFLTHAVLDRYTHPFIIYFSGWREPGEKTTYELYRMHAFFERIIDLSLCGCNDFDFAALLLDVDRYFTLLRDICISGIRKTYTELNKPDLDERSFANACTDALFFYRVTNCADRENIRHAYERDKAHHFNRKLLALYYPRYYDKNIDYLNEKHTEWRDPFYPDRKRTESFSDLYGEAVAAGIEALRKLDQLVRERDFSSVKKEDVEAIAGNGNLSNGECAKNLSPRTASPLPLYEQLVREYCGVEKEFGLDQVFKYEQPVKGAVDCL
mgnify:CR=1 FL=1